MSRTDYTVDVDAYLAKNTYNTDPDYAHIVMKPEPSDAEFDKLVMACPANRYRLNEDGKKSFYYEGCLECGTCRVLCNDTILERWTFPHKDKGIEYQYG